MTTPTYRALIELDNKGQEFRAGFLAALAFLDGAGSAQVVEVDREQKWVHVQFTGTSDNADCTYRIKRGKVAFESLGAVI